MRTFYTYALAGAVTVASLALGAYGDTNAKNAARDVSGKNGAAKLEAIGNQLADPTTAQEVRTLLALAVNDAVTPGKFSQLVGALAKPQRERMNDLKPEKPDELNRVLTQFRADFKAKYNQDFAITPQQFQDAIVYAGRDKNSATVLLPELQLDRKVGLGHPLPEVNGKLPAPVNKPTLAHADAALTGVAAGDASIPPSATKSAVEAAAKQSVPMGLTLNMINEGHVISAWRISIPNEITADQLRGNLRKHIQMLDDQKATWPADADAAYHAAAYHMLEALNDSSLASAR